DQDGDILFWDLEKKVIRGRFPHLGPLASLCLSPDAKTLVRVKGGIQGNGRVLFWDLAANKAVDAWKVDVVDAVFSRDGRFMAALSPYPEVHVRDVGKKKATKIPVQGPISMAAGEDGIFAVIAQDEKRVVLISGASGKVVGTLSLPPGGQRLRYSPDAKTVAIWGGKGGFWLLDIATGKTRRIPIVSRETSVTCLAFSPDGKHIAAGGSDGIVRLWNAAGYGRRLCFSDYQVNAVDVS